MRNRNNNTRRNKPLLVLGMTLALLAGGTVRAQQAEGCMYQVPSQWQSLSVQWIGDCHEIYADGLGVLRVRTAAPGQVFYGQLSRGQAQQGVLDLPSGLQAGRFIQGVWVPARSREERAEAWQIGIDAAKKTSAYFRNAGITRLAQEYDAAMQRLDKQAARSH